MSASSSSSEHSLSLEPKPTTSSVQRTSNKLPSPPPSPKSRNHDHGHLRRRETPYNMSFDSSWKLWSALRIVLKFIPDHFTTWDIHKKVRDYGNVVSIKLLEASRNMPRAASVTFQPPPASAFWHSEQLGRIRASYPEQVNIGKVDDPSHRGAQFPARLTHFATELQLGVMLNENEMISMYNSSSVRPSQIEVIVNAQRKQLQFKFQATALASGNTYRLGDYMFQLRFDKISKVYFHTEDGHEYLTVPMQVPPEVYRKWHKLQETHQDDSQMWTEWDSYVRQTDVVTNRAAFRAMAIGVRNTQALIDLGRWTTYRLAFKSSEEPNVALEQIRRVLGSFNVNVVHHKILLQPDTTPAIYKCLDSPKEARPSQEDFKASADLIDLTEVSDLEAPELTFAVRYQLEVCLSHGWLHESNLSPEFFSKLAELGKSNETRAVGILEKVANARVRIYNPMSIFDLRVNHAEVAGTKNPPRQCTIARSVTITPTRIYFNTPGIEISNRVVRSEEAASDRFLRVRFTDELTCGPIGAHDSNRNDEIYARVKQVLRNGIVLGGRTYEFLAFGNSQFRERGAHFFCPPDGKSVAKIRADLGQLLGGDIYQPAKYCARLGQNFSTTRGLAIDVTLRTYSDDGHKKLLLPDIRRNGFIFSDGVGKVALNLAKMIATDFGYPTEDSPSVFQFRLGGCKGVLTVDPAIGDNEVILRPSQYKFATNQHGLEIIRASSYVTALLNRQIILVLSALGVEDEVFCDKLDEQLKALERALVDEVVAINELEKAVDVNQTTLALAGMALDGFMAAEEPFMMSMLKLWRTWTLKYLKEKARIPIEKGACLLGCVDETATLRGHFYDNQPLPTDTYEEKVMKLPEVFCRVDRKRRGIYESIQGVCIIARNPSLHPGDIRVVRAVDVPALHHIKNALVLPQTGDRDLSNMCSGGDLDGDDYVIIWDQDLIPPDTDWTHAPMDFKPAAPFKLDRPVTVDDMTDFFVEYMRSDRLPTIAHKHLAYADFCEDGVKDSRCIELAQLHSNAVDYPKSGAAVIIPKHLKKTKWPHFMEKHRVDYHSRRILGQLYDKVRKEDFKPDYTKSFDERILSAYADDERLMTIAETVKCRYDCQIKRVMAQYGIETEFEVWSAFVMKHSGEKKDYDFGQELGSLMDTVRTKFKAECLTEIGGKDSAELLPFVAAMYKVTALQVGEAVEEAKAIGESIDSKKMPLMSFPWLFRLELGRIARGDGYVHESVHRVQASPKKHHVKLSRATEMKGADITTAEGVVGHGEVLQIFDKPEEKEKVVEAHADGGYLPRVEDGDMSRLVEVKLNLDFDDD